MAWGHLRSVLGACWGVLVSFLILLEGSWRHLGAILEYLWGLGGAVEASWREVGTNLWIFWIRYDETRVETIFVACFFVFSCKLTFCETLIFVAPVEVFEGFFNVRFLECKYCKPLKHTYSRRFVFSLFLDMLLYVFMFV